jgi:hypothetical protein
MHVTHLTYHTVFNFANILHSQHNCLILEKKIKLIKSDFRVCVCVCVCVCLCVPLLALQWLYQSLWILIYHGISPNLHETWYTYTLWSSSTINSLQHPVTYSLIGPNILLSFLFSNTLDLRAVVPSVMQPCADGIYQTFRIYVSIQSSKSKLNQAKNQEYALAN